MIHELITRLLAAAQREGSLTESLAIEVERQFRHDYKGAEIVVSERPRGRLVEKQAVVVNAYLEGKPVEEITRHHGISRATLYRYLKR
jgi:DNA-binding NarL/FixJ family response regulator